MNDIVTNTVLTGFKRAHGEMGSADTGGAEE